MHKCQGMGAAAVAADARRRPRISSSRRRCRRRAEGRNVVVRRRGHSIASLAKFAGARVPEGAGRRARDDRDGRLRPRRRTFDTATDDATLKPLLDGLVRRPRAAARASQHGHRRRGEIRDRFPSPPEGGEFQQAVAPGQRHQGRGAGRRRRRGAGTAGESERHRRQPRRGDVAIKQVDSTASTGDAACAMTAFTGGGFGFPAAAAARRAAARRPAAAADVELKKRSGGALRAVADDSRETRASPSRTGIAKARPAATRSTPTRRSACRCGRRRSTCR